MQLHVTQGKTCTARNSTDSQSRERGTLISSNPHQRWPPAAVRLRRFETRVPGNHGGRVTHPLTLLLLHNRVLTYNRYTYIPPCRRAVNTSHERRQHPSTTAANVRLGQLSQKLCRGAAEKVHAGYRLLAQLLDQAKQIQHTKHIDREGGGRRT